MRATPGALRAALRSPRFLVRALAIWVLGGFGIAAVVLVVAPSSQGDVDFTLTQFGQATVPPDWATTAERVATQVDAALPSVGLHRSAPPSGQGTACLSWRPGDAVVNLPGDGTAKAAEISVDLGGSTDPVAITVTLASGEAYEGSMPRGLSTTIRSLMPAPPNRPDGPGC